MGAIDDLVGEWTVAEAWGDAAALDALLDEGFQGIGPLGCVHDKEQWLARYRGGDLVNESFGWEDITTRTYRNDGDVAVVSFRVQTSSYQGHDASGRFRASLVAVRRGDRWMIVHLHLGALQASAP